MLRRVILFGWGVTGLLGGLGACGGIAVEDQWSGAAGDSGTGAHSGSGGQGTGGGAPGPGEPSEGPGFQEPECPTEAPPPAEMKCDPLHSEEDCGAGWGCYVLLEYPYGSECGHPRYSSECIQAGQGRQGDECGQERGDYCAAGFTCVVGAQVGRRCAQVCDLKAPNPCPAGLICNRTDMAGYGVCF